MPIIANQSGANDRLLRPLCARRLPPTLPEREGWVNREKLFDFTGRSRKPQMKLAKEYAFSEYSQPAGGCCFLTDKQYSAKLLDLWKTQGTREYELDDIGLLKVGRHLRPAPHFKVIIGREEGENRYLQGYRKQFDSIKPTSHMGPLMLIDGKPMAEDFHLAARILARYSDCPTDEQLTVTLQTTDGVTTELSVLPFRADDIPIQWYVGEQWKNHESLPPRA